MSARYEKISAEFYTKRMIRVRRFNDTMDVAWWTRSLSQLIREFKVKTISGKFFYLSVVGEFPCNGVDGRDEETIDVEAPPRRIYLSLRCISYQFCTTEESLDIRLGHVARERVLEKDR